VVCTCNKDPSTKRHNLTVSVPVGG
jgi:hypothetical protein